MREWRVGGGPGLLKGRWQCRGPAPALGRRAGLKAWDECTNPFQSVPRPPRPRPRAPVREWKLPFPPEGGPARGPGIVGELAGGGDPGPALPF